MKILFEKKYDGLGFVEALIAIMVSGIVATVLISIAVIAMRELVRLDIEDAQAHHARSAAVIVQNIANRERLKEDSDLFDRLNNGACYKLVTEEGEYNIDVSSSYTFNDRDLYKEDAVITDNIDDDDEDYFRIVCVEKKRPGGTNKMLIKVVVGFNKVSGMFSTSFDIKDFRYFAIINL